MTEIVLMKVAEKLAFNYYLGFLESKEEHHQAVRNNKTKNTVTAKRWAGNTFKNWISQAHAILDHLPTTCNKQNETQPISEGLEAASASRYSAKA